MLLRKNCSSFRCPGARRAEGGGGGGAPIERRTFPERDSASKGYVGGCGDSVQGTKAASDKDSVIRAGPLIRQCSVRSGSV